MNCVECQELLQQRLDGDPIPDRATLDAHVGGCAECRSWHSAVGRLTEGLRLLTPPVPREGLSDRIVARVLADRRSSVRWRRRLMVATALAASLLLAALAGYFWNRAPDTGPAAVDVVQDDSPSRRQDAASEQSPSLRESVAEASSAVASLTRRKTDETMGQAQLLWPVVAQAPGLEQPPGGASPLDPPAQSLREAGQGVSAGLEPVANSARRALDLLLREIPPVDVENKLGL